MIYDYLENQRGIDRRVIDAFVEQYQNSKMI